MRLTLTVVAVLALSAGPALAISDAECDREYAAAKTTQSLNGMDRQTFGKQRCATQTQDNAVAPKPAAGSQSPTTPDQSRPKIVTPSKP